MDGFEWVNSAPKALDLPLSPPVLGAMGHNVPALELAVGGRPTVVENGSVRDASLLRGGCGGRNADVDHEVDVSGK